ncbi:MAG: hypothetical protein AAFU85_06105 [Planctomycetota bacterium]
MSWIRPTFLTLQLMCFSGLIALAIGLLLAWSVSQLNSSSRLGKSVRAYVLLGLVVTLATPMVLHAAAWEATAGKFGWLTFSQTAARTYTGFAGQYGGIVACAWVHGLFGAAIVTLGTWFGLTRIPMAVAEQASLDGRWASSWWRVLLPLASPWLIGSMLLVAMLAATEMTVVNLYGVRTLADEFYLRHAFQPSVTAIFMVLVAPAILCIAIITWVVSLRNRLAPMGPTTVSREPISEAPRLTRAVAGALALALATLLAAFPISGLIVKTGHQVTVDPNTGTATYGWSVARSIETLGNAPSEFAREYGWTIAIATAVPCCCVPLAWVIASWSRDRHRFRIALDHGSLLLFLLPGPMVGLLVVRCFSFPIPGFSTLYVQSLLPTILALGFRGLPIAYWILRIGYSGVDASVFDTASLELPWWKRMWAIDRVLMIRPLVLSALAVAVYSSGDVPATLPVIPPTVVTVGTRLFALLHSGARYQEAALAFWYVLAVAVLVLSIAACWKRLDQ